MNKLIFNPEKDIKELEKFEFKPKYNVDTGEIEKYICKVNVGYMEPKEINLITFIKDTYQISFVEYWEVIFEEKCQEAVNLLYDLIKADLIVKE